MPKRKSVPPVPAAVAPEPAAPPVVPAPPIVLAPVNVPPAGSEIPDHGHNPFLVLSPEERTKVRAILTDETFIKTLRIAAKFKPSSAPKGATGSGDLSEPLVRSALRLSEIRGWELYEVALFAVLTEKPPAKPTEEPTYPDAGRLDGNWGKPPKTT